ncbi:UNVERIFIED_CONTAM: hypothetical protein FKN15_020043 [Acipenser sinensis]
MVANGGEIPSSAQLRCEYLLKVAEYHKQEIMELEELAAVISRLIHSLQKTDAQYLFLETFLQTMNREWNGIDRLRLDKFYKLIRMVLRQSFEMLKRGSWDESLVERFGFILSTQVLSAASGAPSGIQFHILDIYMEELATVGAEELTAEQNLKFIDPFCKIAAKTKDRLLIQAIAHSIFDEIVDQSPFAIEDLMKEVQQQGGNVSDDSENKYLSKSKKSTGRQLNGIFPQDEYPEEVSTDEDDDELFGSRRRMIKKKNTESLLEKNSEVAKGKDKKKKEGKKIKNTLNGGVKQKKENTEASPAGTSTELKQPCATEESTETKAKKKKMKLKESSPKRIEADPSSNHIDGHTGEKRKKKKKTKEAVEDRHDQEDCLEQTATDTKATILPSKGKKMRKLRVLGVNGERPYKKKKEGKKIKNTLNGGVKQKKENTEASPAGTSTELKQPCATEESTETKAKKKKMKLKESSPKRIEADPSSNHIDGHTGEKRKKKKKTKEAVEDRHDQEDCLEQTATDTKATILPSKGKKMRKLRVLGVNGERPCLEQATPLEQGHPPSELPKNIKKTVELVQVDPAAEQMPARLEWGWG